MGDKVCVLNDDRIMQVGAPGNIYHHLRNKFIAGLIGSPAMNIMLLDIDPSTRGLRLADNLILSLDTCLSNLLEQCPHPSVWFDIHSGVIQLASQRDASAFDAHVTNVGRTGNEDPLHFDIGKQHMISCINPSPDWTPLPGEPIRVKFNLDAVFLFDKEHEEDLA